MTYLIENILNRPLTFSLKDDTTFRLSSYGEDGCNKSLESELMTPEIENSKFLKITNPEIEKEVVFEKKKETKNIYKK